MIRKEYLSFDELVGRWNITRDDVHYLIADSSLVPSIAWDDLAIVCEWRDQEGCFSLVDKIDHSSKAPIETSINGFVYLRNPKQLGPNRYSFSVASKEKLAQRTPDEHWFRLIHRRDAHIPFDAVITNEVIENRAAFMIEMVENCELIFHPELIEPHLDKSEGLSEHHTSTTKIMTSTNSHSDDLMILLQASTKFWGNADRHERDTHPSNEMVEEWLIKHGFSITLAQKGATIIRPKWAPTGRKPEK